MSKRFLTNIDLSGLSLLNPVLNPLATAPANANPYYLFTSTAAATNGRIYINIGTYDTPEWLAVGAVTSVNNKTGAVVLTQDDVGNGSTYVRTHNDLTDALVTLINGALQKSGGTMTGAIAMGNNKITGLANGTAAGDAVNYGQVTEMISSNTGFFRGSFATKAALDAVQWQTTNPGGANYVTNNDYAVVLDDETHSDECWRYTYTVGAGWGAQYMINEAPMTQAQLDAINSGITAALVQQITDSKTAITQTRAMIAGIEQSGIASKAYEVGEYLIYNNALYRVTASIVSGGNIVTGTNVEATTLAEGLKAASDTANGALQRTGGTMSGDIAMGGNKITGVGNGTAATDAAAFGQIPVAGTSNPAMDGTASPGSSATWSRSDHVHPTDTTRAPLDSPAFTGTPTAPTTSTAATPNTQIATTKYVDNYYQNRAIKVKRLTVTIPVGSNTVTTEALRNEVAGPAVVVSTEAYQGGKQVVVDVEQNITGSSLLTVTFSTAQNVDVAVECIVAYL